MRFLRFMSILLALKFWIYILNIAELPLKIKTYFWSYKIKAFKHHNFSGFKVFKFRFKKYNSSIYQCLNNVKLGIIKALFFQRPYILMVYNPVNTKAWNYVGQGKSGESQGISVRGTVKYRQEEIMFILIFQKFELLSSNNIG